jgi:hypothetical protein
MCSSVYYLLSSDVLTKKLGQDEKQADTVHKFIYVAEWSEEESKPATWDKSGQLPSCPLETARTNGRYELQVSRQARDACVHKLLCLSLHLE